MIQQDNRCSICDIPFDSPLYVSPANRSITTMGAVYEGKTEVYFCKNCGHLQTTELPNLHEYYDSEYEINIQSEEDDQLYKIVDGESVYRADHQAAIFLRKVSLPPSARVLDYGCAKSATLRKIMRQRADIVPYQFDVTDKYIPFWKNFSQPQQWATHTVKSEWVGTMDAVVSFYAFEHATQLKAVLRSIRDLLKAEGKLYFIVPNTYTNTADFVVADHINHFSELSLRRLLSETGFNAVDVDADSHESAFVVVAEKPLQAAEKFQADARQIATLNQRANEISSYWQNIAGRIQEFEAHLPRNDNYAIYGAGFYGNFIASNLRHPEHIACYIDQNNHLQGRENAGKPIVAPEKVSADIKHILIGLNPIRAREIIQGIGAWRNKDFQFFWL